MKLLICIVQDGDAASLMEELVEHSFRVTKLSSTGGFLKSGNTTLFLGVDDNEVEYALEIINKNCSRRSAVTPILNPQLDPGMYPSIPVEVEVGGATIFQLDIDNMYRL